MVVDEVLRALVPTGLLVGGEAQHDGTVRHRTDASPGSDNREPHRVEILHFEGAASPQVDVLHLPGARHDLHVLPGRGNHTLGTVQTQRTAGPVTPSCDYPGTTPIAL